MTKTKKAISLILAVVMIFSIFAINTFAVEEVASFTITAEDTTGKTIGDEIQFTVTGTSNYLAGPISLPIQFDSTRFEYVTNSMTQGAVFGSVQATELNLKPMDSNTGEAWVIITPHSSYTPKAQLLNNTTICTFKLKVLAGGVSSVSILDDLKTAENDDGKLMCCSFDKEDINTATVTMVGQSVTTTPASLNIVGEAPQQTTPELAVKAGTSGVIGTTGTGSAGLDMTGYVYGIPAGDDANDYFEATNGGSIEVSATATGGTITLKNAGGDTVTTYTIVIFGDADGDGSITFADQASLKLYNTGNLTAISAGVSMLAADVDGDGSVSFADQASLKLYNTGNLTALKANPFSA